MIDRAVVRRVGGDDVHRAAARRRHARDLDRNTSGQHARLVGRTHREHVQVEQPVATRCRGHRRQCLAERLLLGQEPRRCGVVEELLQPIADHPVGVDHRVIVQVRADARAGAPSGTTPTGTQMIGVTDPRALQDRRRAVHTGRQHDGAGQHLERFAVTVADHAHAVGGRLEAIDPHVVGDAQGRTAAHRIEVGERRVPAGGAHDVHRLEAERVVAHRGRTGRTPSASRGPRRRRGTARGTAPLRRGRRCARASARPRGGTPARTSAPVQPGSAHAS